MKAARHWGDRGGHNESTQNPTFPGLNGHMTEFEAILGKWGLKDLSYRIGERMAVVTRYKALLGDKVGYQKITPPRTTNYKDFAILVPIEARERINKALHTEGIETKKYFYPCHLTEAYRKDTKLPVTEEYSCRSICLPLHHKLTYSDLELVSHTILENL
jgi:dTDP-4-amino-4,6-dideoxygalactose transaminase